MWLCFSETVGCATLQVNQDLLPRFICLTYRYDETGCQHSRQASSATVDCSTSERLTRYSDVLETISKDYNVSASPKVWHQIQFLHLGRVSGFRLSLLSICLECCWKGPGRTGVKACRKDRSLLLRSRQTQGPTPLCRCIRRLKVMSGCGSRFLIDPKPPPPTHNLCSPLCHQMRCCTVSIPDANFLIANSDVKNPA